MTPPRTLRFLARQARSLVDLGFVRCETCEHFRPNEDRPHAMRAVELVFVTAKLPGESEATTRLMPPGSAALAVRDHGAQAHGRLSEVGQCALDAKGHLPGDRCEAWR